MSGERDEHDRSDEAASTLDLEYEEIVTGDRMEPLTQEERDEQLCDSTLQAIADFERRALQIGYGHLYGEEGLAAAHELRRVIERVRRKMHDKI